MDCDQALTLFVAYMDREIQPEDRLRLNAHLKECAACRSTADAWQRQDRNLRHAFLPRRRAVAAVAQRVIAQLPAAPARGRRRLSWLPMLLAAAAGFLIAVLVFRPWQKTGYEVAIHPKLPENLGPETVLLAVATKAVEVLTPGQSSWRTLPAGGAIAIGSRVRTLPQVRCEFRMADGSEIRLNGDTELSFTAHRRLELSRGQIMARVVEGNSAFQVGIPEAIVTALGTEFDILCKPVESVLTVLQGSTKVEGDGSGDILRKGERATIVKGRITEKDTVDLVNASSWADEILMRKGYDNKELAKRVEDILAQIGATKTDYLSEEEIRKLGAHCVLPLTRFVESKRSLAEKTKRYRAARILADLAQPWSIPDLIQLLGDSDAEVRYYAAKGLKRLTNQTFGREPEDWRKQKWEACEGTYAKWQEWWQQNKERYPSAP
jgi:ferric-dicitrate binding protein FerR (iron transport regulator)